MRELVVSAVELLAYLVTTGVLAAVGLFAELTSVSYVSGGNTKFAVWLADYRTAVDRWHVDTPKDTDVAEAAEGHEPPADGETTGESEPTRN